MDYNSFYESFIAPRDKNKIYQESKEFAADQGLTPEQAAEYAFEVLAVEKENPSLQIETGFGLSARDAGTDEIRTRKEERNANYNVSVVW